LFALSPRFASEDKLALIVVYLLNGVGACGDCKLLGVVVVLSTSLATGTALKSSIIPTNMETTTKNFMAETILGSLN